MSLYNLRNPAVKRLMKEAEELRFPTDEYHAQPLEDNLFEWHFTLRGPPNSDYDGGIYHGRITLPPDYPMKPPSIILLTPNGRFETNKKICLSISGHHPESWQPSWSIRTALLAIIGFMPTHGNGAIGSLDYTPEERKQLSLKSQEWQCPECGLIKDIFSKKKYPSSNDDTQSESPMLIPERLEVESASNTSPLMMNVADEELAEPSTIKFDPDISTTKEININTLHHRKITSSQHIEEPEQTHSDTPKSNVLSSICIWLIVIAIVILCLRRLFSL